MTRPNGAAVALVTCAAHPDLSPDDRVVAQALSAAGMRPVAERWDAPAGDWEDYQAVVIRSCWDYHHRPGEFQAWVNEMETRAVPLLNPAPTVRWNLRKTYLRDLADAGAEVAPTEWVPAGSRRTLRSVLADRGWERVVVKPTISATAFLTWRAGPAITDEDERRFASQAGERDVMIQPYLAEIEADGELSLVFLGGQFSHAVRKRPAAGDFRVQSDFGGTVEPVEPSARLVEQAARVAALTPTACLYARVDGCVVGGRLLLMELEVVEPGLFFRQAPAAADRFVQALRARIVGPSLRQVVG